LYSNSAQGFKNSSDLINYCQEYFRLHPSSNSGQYGLENQDNYQIVFKPMYCSLRDKLGLGENWRFGVLCVQESDRVRIVVNNANSFFNVSGRVQFEGITFTGVNSMTQATLVTGGGDMFQLDRRFSSLIPHLFCDKSTIGDNNEVEATENVNFPF
jgi:hypothetical protein